MGEQQSGAACSGDFKCFVAGAYFYAILTSALGVALNEHPLTRVASLILFMLSLAALMFTLLPSSVLNAVGAYSSIAVLILTVFLYPLLPISAEFMLIDVSTLFLLIVFLFFATLLGMCP